MSCSNPNDGQNNNNDIVKYGMMARNVMVRGAQYAAEHPQNGPVTAIRVGKLVGKGTGGFAIGVAVDITVNLCHFLRNETAPAHRAAFDSLYDRAARSLIETEGRVLSLSHGKLGSRRRKSERAIL